MVQISGVISFKIIDSDGCSLFVVSSFLIVIFK